MKCEKTLQDRKVFLSECLIVESFLNKFLNCKLNLYGLWGKTLQWKVWMSDWWCNPKVFHFSIQLYITVVQSKKSWPKIIGRIRSGTKKTHDRIVIYEGGSVYNENPFITPSTIALGSYVMCQKKYQSAALLMVHETLFYLSKFNKLHTFQKAH